MHCKRFEHIPSYIHVSSAVIFLTTIEYRTYHRLSTQTSYLSGFFHITFVDGWQEQVVPLNVHVIDQAL